MKPVHCTYLGLEEPAQRDGYSRMRDSSAGITAYAEITSEQKCDKRLLRVCFEEFSAYIRLLRSACKKCGRIEQTPESSTCDGCGAPK